MRFQSGYFVLIQLRLGPLEQRERIDACSKSSLDLATTTDIEPTRKSANFGRHLPSEQNSQAEREAFKELETGSATPAVMALRMFNLHRAILAIGMYSLFEALRNPSSDREKPFEQFDAYLRARLQSP